MTETTKRRPIRGLLYGILLGLGLMLVAVGQGWAALGTWPPFLLLIVGIIAGTLWATFGPAKSGKSAAGAGLVEPAAAPGDGAGPSGEAQPITPTQ